VVLRTSKRPASSVSPPEAITSATFVAAALPPATGVASASKVGVAFGGIVDEGVASGVAVVVADAVGVESSGGSGGSWQRAGAGIRSKPKAAIVAAEQILLRLIATKLTRGRRFEKMQFERLPNLSPARQEDTLRAPRNLHGGARS
jgi:hypothetical protein